MSSSDPAHSIPGPAPTRMILGAGYSNTDPVILQTTDQPPEDDDSSYPNLSTPPTVTIIDATQEAEDELEQDHGESVGHEEELPLSPGEVPDESEVPDEPEIPDESIKPAPPPPSDQIEMPPAPPPVIIMDGPKIKMKFHCFFCQRVFVEKKTLVKHQENVCTHSICTQAHQHQVISFDFDTMMEAINWILSQELDQFYATHVSKPETKKFLCIQNNIIRSKTERSVKSMDTDNCHSFFNISQIMKCSCPKDKVKTAKCDSTKKVYWLQGCLAHCHTFDPKKVRVSSLTKTFILNQLKKNEDVHKILELCHHEEDPSLANRQSVLLDDIVEMKDALRNKEKENTNNVPHDDPNFPNDVKPQPNSNPELPEEFEGDFDELMDINQSVMKEPSPIKKVQYEIGPDGSRKAIPSKKGIPELAFHCHVCRAILGSKKSLKYHTEHNICGSKVCNDDHDHNFVEFQFDSMEESLHWIRNQELDQYYIVCTSKFGYKVFRCIRNSKLMKKTQYITKRSKKDTECGSKIIIKRQLKCICGKETKDNLCSSMSYYYILTACLTHCHDLDTKKVRLSNVTKNYVLNLLQQGHEMTQVVKICHEEQATENANRKSVTYLDVKNIRDAFLLCKRGHKRKLPPTDSYSSHVTVTVDQSQVVLPISVKQEGYIDVQSEDQTTIVPMETITVTVPPDPPEAEHPMEPFHYEQFEQERLRVVKRLHEITAFLKSTHPPQLKQEILNEINAKSLMDVVCPSTAIPVPKASMLPRKSDPNKAKKKKKATAFL